VNQQWVEYDVGDDFFAYQKRNTNLCIDGGNGGARGNPVIIFPCDFDNQNQHWQKTSTDSGFFKLIKRNASGFAINGGSNGSNGQNVDLYDASNPSHNLQWSITPIN